MISNNELLDLLVSSASPPPPQEMVKTKVEIISAKYSPIQRELAVTVRLVNGIVTTPVMVPENFRQLDGQPLETIHRELEKTAAMFRNRRGSHIDMFVEKELLE